MEPYTIDVNQLVTDIKGFIAQLKIIYFESKDPIDDNEIMLQKLCVKLETAFRHKMKDKYSFLGVRKDYWNLFSECLPKDEGVRYVSSLSQLQTVQGKGRALIRYCLVQKTLADTIQRTLMHKRKIEWFLSDALLLDKSLSGALVSKLYDLNELEFHLSCTGCDLDMSWPAFGRTLTDGFGRRTRRSSTSSIASTTDFANERTDPLVALNAELSALKQMITRDFEKEKTAIDRIGESNNSSNDEVQLNVGDVTLELSRLHQFILTWKSSIDAKVFKAENEIQRLTEDRNRVAQESKIQLEQLTEKYDNLSKVASSESALKVTDLENKLRTTESNATQYKTEIDSLNLKLKEVLLNYEDCQEELTSIRQQLTISKNNQKQFEEEIIRLKEQLKTQAKEQRTVEETSNDLKLKLSDLEGFELSLKNKLEESETRLRIKTLEQLKLQEAFENVNGLVFSSFDDFESYYKTQLLDREKGLEVKDSENKTLERRLNVLTDENGRLKHEVEESKRKLTSTQTELELFNEKLRKQSEECIAVKSQGQQFEEMLQKIRKVLLEYLLRKSCGVDNAVKEIPSTLDVSCIEEQCQMLIDDLNEAEKQLQVYEKALKTATIEKNKLETGSKSVSLEVERLLKQIEDLKEEKTQLCHDREKEKVLNIDSQKRRIEMDGRVRQLEEEKSKLEETISCGVVEKSRLELEVKALSEKLQEESYLRLENENEVSEIAEQLKKVKSAKVNVLEELGKVKEQMAENRKEMDNKEVELVKYKDELSSVKTAFDATTNDMMILEEKFKVLVEEKRECEEKVRTYQEQLASLQCTMDQEVSALRFQLSSEALKYEGEIKELSKEKQEAIVLKEKIQENEEMITDLENKLKERNETWQSEKKKLTSDIKLLKHEIKVLNDNIDADKEEIRCMESTLMLSKKQYEKEKGRNKEYRTTIKEIKRQKSEKEKLLEDEKVEMLEDIQQLKAKMVSLLSDKSELWKRSNQLEFDMKTRLSEKWVEDKDVTHCPQCKNEFSFFIRKHHCRFCGNVFCHACSDNFVKTIHSRKPYRSCDVCFDKEKELKCDTSPILNTSQLDRRNSNLSSNSFGSDNEADSSSGKTSSRPPKLTVPLTSEATEHETQRLGSCPKISEKDSRQTHSEHSDSDGNYEIIDESEDSLNELLCDDDLNIKSEVFTPKDHEESQVWSDAIIPAGKRYLISANVVSGSLLVMEITSSPQGVVFGVAIKGDEEVNELKTLTPLCHLNSHERCTKKQLQITCSGMVIFILDNTDSKSTVNKIRFKVYLQSTPETSTEQ